jgi:hypothetical protein
MSWLFSVRLLVLSGVRWRLVVFTKQDWTIPFVVTWPRYVIPCLACWSKVFFSAFSGLHSSGRLFVTYISLFYAFFYFGIILLGISLYFILYFFLFFIFGCISLFYTFSYIFGTVSLGIYLHFILYFYLFFSLFMLVRYTYNIYNFTSSFFFSYRYRPRSSFN